MQTRHNYRGGMGSLRQATGLLLLSLAACNVSDRASDSSGQADQKAMEQERGAKLFARHCAACHGKDGNADTFVAELLRPRPAAFKHGIFKLASTDNGVPTEEDLVATLKRGMPGSVMMSWSWLPEQDLRDLAREVQRLAIAGRAGDIRRTSAIGGHGMSEAEAITEAEKQLRAGATVEVGQPAILGDEVLAAGGKLFRRHCATCHGTDGRGLPATRGLPADGTWLWPRDFTSGYLRGGASAQDLTFRVRAGMPGAHMPPTVLSSAEVQVLVAYVQSLIPEHAGQHHVQWQRTVTAPRIPELPGDHDEVAFKKLDAVRLPVAPLWWRAEACDEVWLRAAHDGETLIWQLQWDDATRDDRVRPGAPMGDGAAVQFATTDDPPLFAMGSNQEPVNVWRWHAFDPKETAGMADLFVGTHQGLDVATGHLQPRPRSESLQIGGAGSAADAIGNGLPLTTTRKWHDGRWTLTFRRSLAARSEREVDLSTTDTVRFALAVWDGSIDQHAGSKAITTWHVLKLER